MTTPPKSQSWQPIPDLSALRRGDVVRYKNLSIPFTCIITQAECNRHVELVAVFGEADPHSLEVLRDDPEPEEKPKEPELKACPKCGGIALREVESDRGHWTVYCLKLGRTHAAVYGDSAEDVLGFWNSLPRGGEKGTQ